MMYSRSRVDQGARAMKVVRRMRPSRQSYVDNGVQQACHSAGPFFIHTIFSSTSSHPDLSVAISATRIATGPEAVTRNSLHFGAGLGDPRAPQTISHARARSTCSEIHRRSVIAVRKRSVKEGAKEERNHMNRKKKEKQQKQTNKKAIGV